MVEIAKTFPKIIVKNPETRISGNAIYPSCPLRSNCPDAMKINNDSTEIMFDIIRTLKYFWSQIVGIDGTGLSGYMSLGFMLLSMHSL